MKIYTIGFTRKSAESFFTTLKEAQVSRVVDVRLKNVSQLAGFAKRDDLRFFTRSVCGIGYEHLVELAPTRDILDAYKKKQTDWQTYEAEFTSLMKARRVEEHISRETLDGSCLLCSEDQPQHCHRRLVAEYFRDVWSDVEIKHLM